MDRWMGRWEASLLSYGLSFLQKDFLFDNIALNIIGASS